MVKKELKIDLGCGPNKKENHVGLDKIKFPGVDHVVDLGKKRWPLKSNSVDEAFSSHFVEHLNQVERTHFCNELYRVLKPDSAGTVIVPHWASSRAYGDPTHQWPPIGEFWFYYLDKGWRMANAPHTDKKYWKDGFDCDFITTWGYSINPALNGRSQEFTQFAVGHYREAVFDICANLKRR